MCACVCTCGSEGDHLAPPGAINALLQSLWLQTCPHEDHVNLSSLRLADQAGHVLSGPPAPLQDLQTDRCSGASCIADNCAVQVSAALTADTAEAAVASDRTYSAVTSAGAGLILCFHVCGLLTQIESAGTTAGGC